MPAFIEPDTEPELPPPGMERLFLGAGLGHLLDEAVEPDVLLLIGERCRLDLTSKRRGDAGMVEIAVALFGFPDDEADALPTEGGKRRAAPSNGANGPAIDDELGAVLAIVRCGSFRAAALDLGMSTTAISNAVGKLERELAVRLFNRTTRSVSLTHAGRIFVAQIKPALEDVQKAMNTVRSQQETPSGTLRINAFATAAREIMAPLILSYLQRYPQVHIDLVTEGRLVDVVAAGFDLGVRSADFVPSDAIAIPLGQVRRMAVAASPAFFESRAIPQMPQELLTYPCVRVRLPNGALFRWRFEKGGEELELDVEGPITLDEASLTRIVVTNGVGIGYFMETDVRDDIAAGRLVRILEDWTPPLVPLCLYYSNRRNSSAAFQAFIALARDFAAGRLAQP